jgi:salicylate hydroxylase
VTFIAETTAGDVELRADALIAADGVRSALRELVPGASERKESGRIAWRAVITAERARALLAPDSVGLWLGGAGHVVAYPVRSGREFNIVAVVPAAETQREVETMRRRFRGWRRPLRELLAIEADWRPWPIGTVDPRGSWSEERVALVGDAAHAMAPFLAQGGAMALEDAAVLANAMAETPDDPAGAIARYENVRRSRVARVFRAAETTADLYHMGRLTGAVRNIGMRIIGGRGLVGRYSWIYGWRPPVTKEKRRPEAAPESASNKAINATGSGPAGSTQR